MFNWFGRRNAEDYLDDAKKYADEANEKYNVPPIPKVEEPKQKTKDALYMVGSTDDGMVQLRVGTPTSITLTMNEPAVRQLIRQLEAAITTNCPSEEE